MEDLISRQWLMECVNEGWIKFDTEKDENRFIHLVRDIAPSVHRWIPVTERLPDEGIILVACGKDGDALYVAPADAVRESAYEGYGKAWMQIEPWKGEHTERWMNGNSGLST